MRATINEKGYLEIKAETPIEAYALDNWHANFMKGNERSVMGVQLDWREEAKDGNQR